MSINFFKFCYLCFPLRKNVKLYDREDWYIMVEKVIDIFNRLFVLWVILSGIFAFFYPGIFVASRGYMELFFACTMFGIGIILNPRDFMNILKNIRVVLIGVIAQFTIMPLSAYLVSNSDLCLDKSTYVSHDFSVLQREESCDEDLRFVASGSRRSIAAIRSPRSAYFSTIRRPDMNRSFSRSCVSLCG